MLAPSLQLFIGLRSRTFKEAHTNLSLLMFVPMLPGFLFAFGSVQPQPWMAWTPILGQQVLMSAVLRGEALSLPATARLAAVCLAGAAILITATAALLNREALVRSGA